MVERTDLNTVDVRPVPPPQQGQAIQLVLSYQAEEIRASSVSASLDALSRGKVSPDGLFQAYRGTVVVGAVWANVLPGRTASVWAPQLSQTEEEATAQLLLQAVDRFLQSRRVRMAQSLLEVGQQLAARRLERAGYVHAADLLYLVSLANHFPVTSPAGRLEFQPYTDIGWQRLGRLIEETYRGTLDMPRLNGVCPIDDVLTGYHHTGAAGTQRWFFVRHAGRDVGCLLLADHPEQGQLELVYMGLVPQARGKQWGLEVARFAQWTTRLAGRNRLVLAVDAANEPAIGMYVAAGFADWERRRVFMKLLAG